jgi:hypothetical protein
MLAFFTGKWSSYLAGVVVAFLFVLSLYVLNDSIGFSDPYLMISSYCERSIEIKRMDAPPEIDWQTAFLIGIFAGALGAALAGKEWRLRILPEANGKNALASMGATIATGIAGGFLVMLGLQIAGDSFLGLWSGALQASTGAWLVFASLLLWGIILTSTFAILKRRGSTSGDGESEKGK